ncbi:MAG: ATP synthase F1 subunit gamma [Phycisphaerales bacterium]
MAKAREIKKRMKAVGNIRRITKTMQMIATSKFAKAQQRATASKPYVEGIFELVTELASKAGNITHPLIAGPEGGKTKPGAKPVLLLITSDRGLCGPYNASILRAFFRTLKEEGGGGGSVAEKFNVEIVGRKGVGTLTYNKIATTRTHQFGDTPRYEEIERLAQQYMDQFTRGEITSVKIVSMRFISTARQRPEVMQLLPLKAPASTGAGAAEAKKGPTVQYDFTPPPEQLLADLLPATVKATLYQVFNDAIVSEHVARMIAMKSATDAAGKMGKLLNRRYNRARQSQITTELTEIISGAAALE